MRYDFNQKLLNLDGDPMPAPWDETTLRLLPGGKTEEKFEPVRLGDLVVHVLTSDLVDPSTGRLMAVKEGFKAERYAVAFDIRQVMRSGDGVLDVKVEMVASIKKLLEKAFSPLYVGPAWRILETPSSEKGAATEDKEPEAAE